MCMFVFIYVLCVGFDVCLCSWISCLVAQQHLFPQGGQFLCISSHGSDCGPGTEIQEGGGGGRKGVERDG